MTFNLSPTYPRLNTVVLDHPVRGKFDPATCSRCKYADSFDRTGYRSGTSVGIHECLQT